MVTLRVIRDGKIGTASTNRLDDDGLRELAQRAAEAADSAVAEEGLPGLRARGRCPTSKATTRPSRRSGWRTRHHARAAIDASTTARQFGFFTSGVTDLAIVSSAGVERTSR